MEKQIYSASKQIRALVGSVRGRALRGHYDYERDLGTLQKYRDQAHALGDALLEAEVMNVMAIMNSFSGYFHNAVEQLQQNYQIYHQLGDVSGMSTSVNNQAALYRKMGKGLEAIPLYDQGIQLATEYAGQVEKHAIASYPQLLAGKLVTLVMLGRYDELPPLFDEVVDMGEKMGSADRLGFSRTMTYVYRAKAELELSQQQVAEAKATSLRALELAQVLNLIFELAEIHLVQAHIALLGENRPAEAESFWKKAEEIVSSTPVTFNTGCLFAEEARYLSRAGQVQKAKYFAGKATALLNQTKTPEVAQITQSLQELLRGVGR